MLKYFESKVKGLNKEDFAVGPMQVPDDVRGSSFLGRDPQHEGACHRAPQDPNDNPALGSVLQTQAHDEGNEDYVRPSNEYVLVSLSRRFLYCLYVYSFS
jgi:hypothetical protein